MTSPDQAHPDRQTDPHNADPDQPEVRPEQNPRQQPESDQLPSQAEGERETVEADLEEKFNSRE